MKKEDNRFLELNGTNDAATKQNAGILMDDYFIGKAMKIGLLTSVVFSGILYFLDLFILNKTNTIIFFPILLTLSVTHSVKSYMLKTIRQDIGIIIVEIIMLVLIIISHILML